MRTRQILLAIVIVGTLCEAAAAQSKKKIIQLDAPPVQAILAGTSIQSDSVLADLLELKPTVPFGPQDVLKSYEIAMNMVADKTSDDFAIIVQAHKADQITREQAEYLLQETYETAMMQYQVLSALHDVLMYEIGERVQQERRHSPNTKCTDAVLVVPFPDSASAAR